ncbi:TerB family tellurite resistance protein [Novosphingobium sp. BL-52-GroH]|uniref:tellurite resistance TerB family protein n=1 Tax=Novosphingobium sp. BL-52-GroH TaxID=3349877 RepID=UPI00384B0E7F
MADGAAPERPVFDHTGLERVVADPLRFKSRLRIGEDAFVLLRTKKRLLGLWDTAGAAATGAGVASSSLVAGTFFAPTGLAATLGLATAATPVGWVVAAAVVAGGGWYGASRWFSGKGDSFVETIPKYINTPIDVLGAALLDLLGSLALRVAAIDGAIDPRERDCIVDHFVRDWGLDPDYVARALDVLTPLAQATRVKAIAQDLARFAAANPDCNAPAMQAELMTFLHELVAADGTLDEREELALEAIERVLEAESRLTLAKAGSAATETLSDIASTAVGTAGSVAGTLAGKAASVGGAVGDVVGGVAHTLGSTVSKTLKHTIRAGRAATKD